MRGFWEDRKGILDNLVGKLISRKFLVWITSSVFLLGGAIDSEQWTIFSFCYLTSEAVNDIISRYFSSKGDMMVATRESLNDPSTPPVITNEDEEVGI